MSSSRRHGAFGLLVRVLVFALLFGVVSEVWLRTVMPACETPGYYQQDPQTIVRRDPHGPTRGLYTTGRLCRRGGEWRINRSGWNSAVEYVSEPRRGRPLVALFGDSYVEAFLTDVDQHVDAYLPRMLPGTGSYAFGLAGTYLEQYVAMARYARPRFRPDVIVVFLDVGDVSDSVRENGVRSSYWWQIGLVDGSYRELPPSSRFTPSLRVDLAKRSAVLNYLRYNAKLALPGAPNATVAQPRSLVEAGEDAAATGGAWRSLLPPARFMVDTLCAQNPGVPTVFAAHDADYRLAEAGALPALFPDARAVQAACAGRPHCSFLDLRVAFAADFAAHGLALESADGGHWNARGNRLVARTLADFITARSLLPSSSP